MLATGAGHDAGILAAAGVPAAMLFVRNPTGVSHSPAEHAERGRLPGRGATRWPPCIAELRRMTTLLGRARLAARRPRRAGVRLEVADGRFTAASSPAPRRPATTRLAGRRAARASPTPTRTPSTGRCAGGPTTAAARSGPGGSAMYAVAGRLDPDSYLALARATYAEMALAGVTAVGEFHYLHHGPGGAPYADPNAMAEALRQAAAEAGVRLTLLDTCYLAGGLAADGYRRWTACSGGSATATRTRGRPGSPTLAPSDGMRVGAAVHSVRAVPADAAATVAVAAAGRPLHVHLSEQPAENEACLRLPRPHPDRAARRARRAARPARPPCTPPT